MTARRPPPVVDEAFVPVPSSAVHTVELDGEAVLLDEAANRLHHLNSTATLVWACLDGTASLGAIVADLSDALATSHELILTDTIAVTRMLGDEGLLANLPPAPAAPTDV